MEFMATNTGANIGFEAELWKAADQLRGSMDPSEYKHVVLGLLFLKYISDAFEEQQSAPIGRTTLRRPLAPLWRMPRRKRRQSS
jgi:type I restriction-modification system DNA methylase subunit